MAGGIVVTPEQLETISTQLNNGSQEVQSILSQLTSIVSPLQQEWVGSAQQQFEVLWDQWQKDGAGLQQALIGIAQLTAQASQAYASTEQSIAGSFNQS